MARPIKLDDITAQAVLNGLSAGLPRVTAAKVARISPSTLFDWLRRGREGEEPFSEFLERAQKAEGQGEAELVARIREASKTTWTAAAWLLERRLPQRWGRKDRGERSPVAPAGVEHVDVPMLESILAAAKSSLVEEPTKERRRKR